MSGAASAHNAGIKVAYSWYCPECKLEAVVGEWQPNRFHTCPKLRYLSAPMLRQGVAGKLELVERQDYVGKETVRLDPERGRPVAQIVTHRDNGKRDTIVFAPTATSVGEIPPRAFGDLADHKGA